MLSVNTAEEGKVGSLLKGFAVHGVRFTKQSGDQRIGDCPFSGKKEKFYVNANNGLWDSKTAGLAGNFQWFLEKIAKQNEEQLSGDEKAQRALAIARGLPRSAFEGWGIGWNGQFYTIPIRNGRGVIVDLRRYRPGGKAQSTPGASTGLIGAERLAESRRGEQVFVCEGEWDAIALQFLLNKLGVGGVCVGVPGANTFKKEWIPLFDGKPVQTLYDNDEAGESGELIAKQRLTGVAKELSYIQWPVGTPDGFDVRDWVRHGIVVKKVPRGCWTNLQKLFIDTPRRLRKVKVETPEEAKKKGKKALPPVAWPELSATFRKWLHLKSDDPLAVVFGTAMANRLDGDPLWLFLVGPPGSLKSELCLAMSAAELCYPLSSLTPHALVSGSSFQNGEDPSLLPKLDGKVLVIKDFTTVLGMHPTTRDEIFSQLRDAYDGEHQKQFGNGIIRRYKSHFGIVAGVTPAIDQFSSLAGLGERFLKYRLEKNLRHEDEEARIRRAIKNVSHEVGMRDELQEVSARFLAREAKLPAVDPVIESRIVRLAMLTARLRGIVARDKYNAQLQTSKASYEVGTRVGKQLTKLAFGVAMFYGAKVVDERAFNIVAQVALSSAPDKVEEVVRTLYENTEPGEALKTKEVAEKAEKLTQSTVFRCLQDLYMLGLVEQLGIGLRYQWSLPLRIRELIDKSRIYKTTER